MARLLFCLQPCLISGLPEPSGFLHQFGLLALKPDSLVDVRHVQGRNGERNSTANRPTGCKNSDHGDQWKPPLPVVQHSMHRLVWQPSNSAQACSGLGTDLQYLSKAVPRSVLCGAIMQGLLFMQGCAHMILASSSPSRRGPRGCSAHRC